MATDSLPADPLLALYKAFWDDMQGFYIGAVFDAKGSYSQRKSEELNAIKRKYQAAIDHELTKRTLGL